MIITHIKLDYILFGYRNTKKHIKCFAFFMHIIFRCIFRNYTTEYLGYKEDNNQNIACDLCNKAFGTEMKIFMPEDNGSGWKFLGIPLGIDETLLFWL